MRCRPNTKPLASGHHQEEVIVMTPRFVEMTDEEFDRVTAVLARILRRWLDEVEPEVPITERLAA